MYLFYWCDKIILIVRNCIYNCYKYLVDWEWAVDCDLLKVKAKIHVAFFQYFEQINSIFLTKSKNIFSFIELQANYGMLHSHVKALSSIKMLRD
jgi:hypothetical protein